MQRAGAIDHAPPRSRRRAGVHRPRLRVPGAGAEAAFRLRAIVEVGRGGTEQARFERDVIGETIVSPPGPARAGRRRPVFGRIDRERRRRHGTTAVESFHIGRIAVADEHREPVVVDWRAPVAEPFYRATGREPMGLVRRRHFATRGRPLLGIEDELFGEGHLGIGSEDDGARSGLRGYGTLIAALETAPHRASSATSSPPSRASRTRSSGRRSPACWWCRAVRARARRSWRCTGPPTCSTPTASRSRTRACW